MGLLIVTTGETIEVGAIDTSTTLQRDIELTGNSGGGINALNNTVVITTNGFNINSHANTYGIYINPDVSTDSSILTINGTGGNLLRASTNDLFGIYVYGLNETPLGNSKININNMNVVVNGNAISGIHAENGGLINIRGNGHNLLQANNNLGFEGKWSNSGIVAIGGQINITNMNVEANRNRNGILVSGGNLASITGNGRNTLQANNNSSPDLAFGITATGDGSKLSIVHMNIQTNDNKTYGILASRGELRDEECKDKGIGQWFRAYGSHLKIDEKISAKRYDTRFANQFPCTSYVSTRE